MGSGSHEDVQSSRETDAASNRRNDFDGAIGNASSFSEVPMCPPDSPRASAITFSRHDSLFSFGVSSSRNAAELKSFLGNSSSRLKPGAAVLPLQSEPPIDRSSKSHAVSLEQAKPRARVEVDIVLENDCCVEGGFLRGSVKLRVRKRQKKDAPVLLADGKVRVIGFEGIPGESDRHAFYQRASSLCSVTDAYTGIYDSPPDEEGFSRVMEGVHILPFAMHLAADNEFGSPRGSPSVQAGVIIRYIAMISVKVKDSKSGKRSIAHFYRDCHIWPRLDPAVVLAVAPRPIQASTVKSLSVIGGGNKVKLTAMLPRLTWIAGQRCYVHLSVANETKKSLKSLTLMLVRTITLFKPKPVLDAGNCHSIDPDACQTATTHKVIAETVLERSQGVAKGHASAQGWWTGVAAGQEAQFAHYILINPDALSIARARLIEVEYSIRITLSAGALTSDVQVTLPVHIVNFLSLDPLPSAPLLASDGSYARLVPPERATGNFRSTPKTLRTEEALSTPKRTPIARVPCAAPSGVRTSQAPYPRTFGHSSDAAHQSEDIISEDTSLILSPGGLHVVNPDIVPPGGEEDADDGARSEPPSESTSNTSFYSTDSYSSVRPCTSHPSADCTNLGLGNLDLSDDAASDDEVDFVLRAAHPTPTPECDSGGRPPTTTATGREDPCEDELEKPPSRTSDARSASSAAGALPPPSNSNAATATGPECTAPPSQASLRSSHLSVTHRRPAGPRRSESESESESTSADDDSDCPTRGVYLTDDGFRGTAENASPTRASANGRPVRPERSPLRTRTGPSRRVGSDGLTSFERRVQEKKRALLASRGRAVPPAGGGHVRDSASGSRAEDQDADEDDGATPRLGSWTAPSGSCALAQSTAAAAQEASRDADVPPHRPSRQLPVPPPRPSLLHASSSGALSAECDIPPSVSALEALRASRLGRSGSSCEASHAHYVPPGMPSGATAWDITGPPPLVPSNSSSSSSERSSSYFGNSHNVSPGYSSELRASSSRPTDGLLNVGSSDTSMVKGRIAAFEERLKSSQDMGAAYA
ncbi:hypothetical protein BD413DRAFT_609051 [Trametes elegans]|nr:hypothetical protein BD413DRAFT_609051 [Trametes elegans]